MTERWLPIPGYAGAYEVSDLGRVRSLARRVRIVHRSGTESTRGVPARNLKPGAKASGHVTVALGKGNSCGVHQLVMSAFVGPCPEGMEVLHGNHCPADNRLSNLRYGTRGDNLRMDYAAGSRTVNPKFRRAQYTSRVTDEQRAALAACRSRGEAIALAPKFAISAVYANRIRLNAAVS